MEPVLSAKTPAFVVSEVLLRKNLQRLEYVRKQTGCKILLAQKAFSMFHFYPLVADYLDGCTASGLYEARLGFEELGKENHVFSPAYTSQEFDALLEMCDHLIFNSFSQWQQFREAAVRSGKSCGLRINPECSTQIGPAIYDPCSAGSRLGITADQFDGQDLSGIDGLHFHTLCEQNADALVRTLEAVEHKFSRCLKQMKWVNFGGGHHITRADYDIELLIKTIHTFKETYDVEVYLEPGEAVALNAGFLVSTVVDIVTTHGVQNAILDTSATCHMPDVLEMPYRPTVIGSGKAGEKANTYRLGGPTCLAGDIIGDYSFDLPLERGTKIVFCDMAIYSMVKTNTFNGMPLPSIYALTASGQLELVRAFDYRDFKNRLS
ncbi:carboxynorspermidine decarboxylase [Vagococcus acidifermentans]|uniref:Carboxynorspermidine decarboxylase n=2 Tax=Vagococcus acidifermentans TaxID=564710 RepID=A0A430ANC8_9ENTE|nr:carboxynorspermidine decarboxylase [Vagococcus acidifermentans]